jgi:drug/metabolite transporter (DMT)-like permease
VNGLGLGFGLLAALVYGAADLSGGLASRRMPALTVMVGAYLVSMPLMVAGTLVEGVAAVAPSQIACALVGGASEAVATLLLYAALAAGTMSLVSPCVSVLGASLPLVVSFGLGERLPGIQAVGICLALVAVVVISRPTFADRASRRCIALAGGAGIAYAVSFVAFAAAEAVEGGAGSWQLALVSRLVGVGLVGTFAVVGRRPLLASGAGRPFVVLAGLLDGIALTCLLAAYGSGPLGLTTVVASLYPAVTVVLAATLLRERIGRLEMAGVACALGAVALIGLP